MTAETAARRDRVVIEQRIARPPEAVWPMLTTPEGLARWWATGDVRAEVGHRFTLDMRQWGEQPCEVLEVVAERRFVFAFRDWVLDWTLEPVEGGTLLRLVHSGFDPEIPRHVHAFETMGQGWRNVVLPRLAALVEEGGPQTGSSMM